MKSLALLVFLAGVAGASERYPLYPDHHVPDEAALRRADEVVASCHFSEMARIGPSMSDLARCNTAEKKLLSLGSRAVPAVFDRLDGPALDGAAIVRLYDVLARVGTMNVVEPLVGALERENQEGLGNPRHWERGHIVTTLERITHVELKGTPAIQWRQWADAHAAQPTQTAKAEVKPAS